MTLLSFPNCTSAWAAGVADIRKGSANYKPVMDRDDDGVACEAKDAPSWFVSGVGAYPPPAVDGKPLPARTTSPAATTAAVDTPRLPQTGPGEITAIGLGLAAAGAATVLLVRRRRNRYSA